MTKAKTELEKQLLVYSRSFHTEKGYHTTELMQWEEFMLSSLKSLAIGYTINDAFKEIEKICPECLKYFL